MIKGQEVFKCIDPKANFLTQDSNDNIWWYETRPTKCDVGWFYFGHICGNLGKIQIEEFADKDWQDCILEKEQDPKEWIGCLCWFWDDNYEEGIVIGILTEINDDSEHQFKCEACSSYQNCRPAKKSEVKFFEEKE